MKLEKIPKASKPMRKNNKEKKERMKNRT